MKERLWSVFWSRAGAVSIRVKVMGIVAVSILISALALVWYTDRDVSVALRNELERRGVAIGTSLVAQSRDLILTDNQFALYALIKSAVAADKDLVYAFVLDGRGNVLVHSFAEWFPTDLLDKNQLEPGQPYRVQILRTDRGTIQDVAIPVLGGQAGVVRLGVAETSINNVLAGYVRATLLWVVLILVLGLTLAYGLASILTEPVSRLAAAARAIGEGNFRWRTPIWAKDEIGALGRAFNEMSEQLRHKEQMRLQLLAKVISAQEEERKRIARELHDETGQALTSLIVGLKTIEDATNTPQVNRKTTELRAVAAQTLDEVRLLAAGLRPSLLDDLGLGAAVQKYIKEYATKMKINVDFHISGLDGRRLPSEIEVAVYRIIQEALTNIARHARANEASVVLEYRDSSLIVVIEDDGQGFDVNAVAPSTDGKGLGLFGMYERASLIGGKMTIESQPARGTTVFLEVPLTLSREVANE